MFFGKYFFDNRFGLIRAEVDPESGAEGDVDQASQVWFENLTIDGPSISQNITCQAECWCIQLISSLAEKAAFSSEHITGPTAGSQAEADVGYHICGQF